MVVEKERKIKIKTLKIKETIQKGKNMKSETTTIKRRTKQTNEKRDSQTRML